jgi:hypothetical protein
MSTVARPNGSGCTCGQKVARFSRVSISATVSNACDARHRNLARDLSMLITSGHGQGMTHCGLKIGLEATPDAYVGELVSVFREVRRVLRDDGTVWLNLGDSYAGGGGHSPNARSSAYSKSGLYGRL